MQLQTECRDARAPSLFVYLFFFLIKISLLSFSFQFEQCNRVGSSVFACAPPPFVSKIVVFFFFLNWFHFESKKTDLLLFRRVMQNRQTHNAQINHIIFSYFDGFCFAFITTATTTKNEIESKRREGMKMAHNPAAFELERKQNSSKEIHFQFSWCQFPKE